MQISSWQRCSSNAAPAAASGIRLDFDNASRVNTSVVSLHEGHNFVTAFYCTRDAS